MPLVPVRFIGFIIFCVGAGSACEVPTSPGPMLPFDTRPRITNVNLGAAAPTSAPVSVNVEGSFFLDGLKLTVRAPDAQMLRFEGSAIQHLTGSSFDVRMPLTDPGVYFFSVQNEQGLSSPAFQLPLGAP